MAKPRAAARRLPALAGRLQSMRAGDYALLAAFACLAALSAILALSGHNPVGFFTALFRSLTGVDSGGLDWNPRYPAEWISISIPVLLCGLSVAFAAKAGMFNMGAEGQYIAGLTAAQLCASLLPPIPFIAPIAAILAAVAVAFLWGTIAGALKARLGASEVVVTLMLNFVALYLSRLITAELPGASTVGTPEYPAAFSLHLAFLDRISGYSSLNGGIALAALALAAWQLVVNRTAFGFALKATGNAPLAARSAGIDVARVQLLSMGIAGAFAGLGGALVALGMYPYGRVLEGFDGYGFTGIAAALVGGGGAAGTLVGSLAFGLLNASSSLMQSRGIPREAIPVFTGLVTAFMALRLFARGSGEAPNAGH